MQHIFFSILLYFMKIFYIYAIWNILSKMPGRDLYTGCLLICLLSGSNYIYVHTLTQARTHRHTCMYCGAHTMYGTQKNEELNSFPGKLMKNMNLIYYAAFGEVCRIHPYRLVTWFCFLFECVDFWGLQNRLIIIF